MANRSAADRSCPSPGTARPRISPTTSPSWARREKTVAGLVAAILLARWVGRPLGRLLSATQAMARGDYSQRVEPGGPPELVRLAESFNDMSAEVERSRALIGRFVSTLSHELRTPLTSIRGFAQAVLDGSASSPEAVQRAMRVVDREGIIRTVAGTGAAGVGGDGPALAVELNGPKHLCVDAKDLVWIADTENHVIRRFRLAQGTIERIAGTGQEGSAGVGGPALGVQLSRPHGVAIGPDGQLYISDSGNGRILRLEP